MGQWSVRTRADKAAACLQEDAKVRELVSKFAVADGPIPDLFADLEAMMEDDMGDAAACSTIPSAIPAAVSEDFDIFTAMEGPKKWSAIAADLPGRVGKQCRERCALFQTAPRCRRPDDDA
jgi:hypothetical protein